jgi:hypothetical protein
MEGTEWKYLPEHEVSCTNALYMYTILEQGVDLALQFADGVAR